MKRKFSDQWPNRNMLHQKQDSIALFLNLRIFFSQRGQTLRKQGAKSSISSAKRQAQLKSLQNRKPRKVNL
jgi:hypothetical protein